MCKLPSIQRYGVAYLEELRRKGVSPYPYTTIIDYFYNRMLPIGRNSTLQTICGVPQGSVVGPTVWNVYYVCILPWGLPLRPQRCWRWWNGWVPHKTEAVLLIGGRGKNKKLRARVYGPREYLRTPWRNTLISLSRFSVQILEEWQKL